MLIPSIAITATILCTPANYAHSIGCTPVTFEQTHKGWNGTLKNGEKFTQEYITRDMMLFQTESGGLRYLTYKDVTLMLD